MQSKLSSLQKLLLNFNLTKEAQSISSLVNEDIDWEAELGQEPQTDDPKELIDRSEKKLYGDWLSAIPHMIKEVNHQQRLTEAGNKYFYRMASGSYRTVYGIRGNDDWIIKVQRLGDNQNRKEFMAQKLANGLFPKVYKHGPLLDFEDRTDYVKNQFNVFEQPLEYKWLLIENVREVNWREFDTYFPKIAEFVRYMDTEEGKKKYQIAPFNPSTEELVQLALGATKYYGNDHVPQHIKDAFKIGYEQEKLFKDIYELSLKLGTVMDDIRESNVGKTSDGRFVVLDIGFHNL